MAADTAENGCMTKETDGELTKTPRPDVSMKESGMLTKNKARGQPSTPMAEDMKVDGLRIINMEQERCTLLVPFHPILPLPLLLYKHSSAFASQMDACMRVDGLLVVYQVKGLSPGLRGSSSKDSLKLMKCCRARWLCPTAVAHKSIEAINVFIHFLRQ